MTDDTLLLIGSLSNDLFRIATLTERGSTSSAERFLQEAKKWSRSLKNHVLKKYILNIVEEISSKADSTISMEDAEKYLMYGILLQNYTLYESLPYRSTNNRNDNRPKNI